MILAFCELKVCKPPKEWAEGAAAVQLEWCRGAVGLPLAPGRGRLRLKSWLRPCTPLFPGGAPVWVLLGILPNQKPVPGRCTAAEWRRTTELQKGRSKSLWSNILWKSQEVEIIHCSTK